VSPVRRLLLLGTALVAVLVVAGVLVLHAVRGGGSTSVTAPAVPQDRPGTVLLVPGYGGSTASLDVLAARLRAAGRTAVVVRLPGDGTEDLDLDVPPLAAAAQAALAGGAPSVDVVGYSAGGVVARLWEASGGAAVTRRVVTLGSPHHGTTLAGLGARLVPAICPTACQQLVPGSPLLDRLNRGDETPAGPAWLSLWTAVDQTVTPPDSARLSGATDVRLQDLCPGATTTHSDLPRDPRVQAVVLAALGAGPLRAPTSCG
jgi:triacylglycerol lipase